MHGTTVKKKMDMINLLLRRRKRY